MVNAGALMLALTALPSFGSSSNDHVSHFSSDYSIFLRQVWQKFVSSSLINTGGAHLAEWVVMGAWKSEKSAILAFKENYAFVMDHFCDSIDINAFPNSTGVVARWPRWLKLKYVDGCPNGDPSFAKPGQLMLANGLGCLSKTKCLPGPWLYALQQNFEQRSKHVRRNDLFFPADVATIPYVDKEGERVLPYSSYRFGLYLDFLIGQSVLTEQRRSVLMEVGAGWGGLAALVKGKFPSTRYIILDIPTSTVFQMGLLHRLGHKKILSLDANATAADAQRVLCCEVFDFLFIGPTQVELLPSNAIDVTVNFDSMVEMPKRTIALYLKQIARVSRTFYHVNRRAPTHSMLGPRIRQYMLNTGSWKLTHVVDAPLHWRAPPLASKLASATNFNEKYTEQFLQRNLSFSGLGCVPGGDCVAGGFSHGRRDKQRREVANRACNS